MTTALAEAQLVRTAFEYGCQAYATKPIDTKKFIEVMEKLGLIGADNTAEKEDSRTNASPRKSAESSFSKAKSEECRENAVGKIPDSSEKGKNTPKRGMHKKDSLLTMGDAANLEDDGYFKSVCALPDYQIEVTMGTGTTIQFDFGTRLNTARFGALRDEELFGSVSTDGDYLIFDKAGRMPVKITASEFMDLVLIDRTK
jgi:two-component system chemotaxis response regulator CheY